jgi:hypothetical protein
MRTLNPGWLILGGYLGITLSVFALLTKSTLAAFSFPLPILLLSAAITHVLRKGLSAEPEKRFELLTAFTIVWAVCCFGGFVLWDIATAPST